MQERLNKKRIRNNRLSKTQAEKQLLSDYVRKQLKKDLVAWENKERSLKRK